MCTNVKKKREYEKRIKIYFAANTVQFQYVRRTPNVKYIRYNLGNPTLLGPGSCRINGKRPIIGKYNIFVYFQFIYVPTRFYDICNYNIISMCKKHLSYERYLTFSIFPKSISSTETLFKLLISIK